MLFLYLKLRGTDSQTILSAVCFLTEVQIAKMWYLKKKSITGFCSSVSKKKPLKIMKFKIVSGQGKDVYILYPFVFKAKFMKGR